MVLLFAYPAPRSMAGTHPGLMTTNVAPFCMPWTIAASRARP